MIEIAIEITETVFINDRELDQMRARAKSEGYDPNLITEEKVKEVIEDNLYYHSNTIENFIEEMVIELGENQNDLTINDITIVD